MRTEPVHAERWAPVPLDYWAADYEVSDLGRVRRPARVVPCSGGFRTLRACFIKPVPGSNGYHSVCLCRDGRQKSFLLSRLVCTAFNGPPPPGPHDAAHRDGDRSNNAASNLRWAEHRDNIADKLVHGTAQVMEKNPARKLTRAQAEEIRSRRALGQGSLNSLARDYGVSKRCIQFVVTGRTWSNDHPL